MPRVSVVLSSKNGAAYIERAIESVLSQSFTDFEFIIINDGSTDNTLSLIKEFADKDRRVVCLDNGRNIGIQKSVNGGLRIAKGEYIARIDDDDFWIDSEKLAKQIDFLDRNKDYVVVGTGVVMFNEEGKELFRFAEKENDSELRKRILKKDPFTNSSVLIRKSAILKVGLYREDRDALHVEDYDMFLMLGRIGKFKTLQEYMTGFTMRKGGISGSNKLSQFRKGLSLLKRYRRDYPGGTTAFICVLIKIIGYFGYRIIPESLKMKAFSIYKRT